MDQIEQLSPVWKSLSVEIVLRILDFLIEDILTTCGTYPDWFTGAVGRHLFDRQDDDVAERQATRALLTAGAVLRQGCDLFNYHKPRIERYFRDEWLSTMVFLVCVDFSRGYWYCYFSVPQQTQNDHTSSVADSIGEATFFLHTPAIILDQTAAFHFFLSAPLNEQQGLHALLTVWENHKKDDILNEDHLFFMVGSIPSARGTVLDQRYQVPMDRQVLWSDASPIKFEGLEVHDGGRSIRFKWHNLLPMILHTTYAVEEGNDDRGENSI